MKRSTRRTVSVVKKPRKPKLDPRVKAARETTRAAEAAHIKENGL